MNPDTDRFYVLTGGPGSGKSTLVERLRDCGYSGTVEAGRGIIQDQIAIGGSVLPWNNPEAYAEMMMCWEMRSHHIACDQPGPVFFDRGVPDVIGYLRLLGLPVPARMEKAAKIFRYNRRVLVAPPWPEIYRRDAERKQDLDEAELTYVSMCKTYTDFEYELVELPRVTVDERLRFLIQTLGLPS